MKILFALLLSSTAYAFGVPVGQMSVSDPRTISGCISYSRSDLGVTTSGGRVTSWSDLSGNSHGFTDPSTIGPTLTANQLNGMPGIVFGGSQALQWALTTSSGAKTVAVVLKLSADPGPAAFSSFYSLSGSSGAAWSEWVEFNTLSGYQAQSTIDDVGSSILTAVGYGGTGTGGLLGIVNGYVLIKSYNGSGNTTPANYSMTQNAITETVVSSSSFLRTASDLPSIGGRMSAAIALTASVSGSYFAVAVWNRALTTAEIAVVHDTLRTPYGVQ